MNIKAFWNKSPGLRLCAISGGVVVVIFVTIGLMLFSRPNAQDSEFPDYSLLDSYGVMTKIFRHAKKNYNVQETSIVLSKSEATALIHILEGAMLFSKDQCKHLHLYHLHTDNESVAGYFCYDTKQRWLFGGVIKLSYVFDAKLENAVLFIKPKKLRAGVIPIPVGLINPRTENLNERLNGEMKLEKMIKSLQVLSDGGIKFDYYPLEMKRFIEKKYPLVKKMERFL